MASQADTGERIERYAANIDNKLRADEEATDAMKVFTASSLRRVLKDCGYSKRGSTNTSRIQDALVRRAVYPDPPLTTRGLDWNERIYFTRTPPTGRPAVHRVRFPAERDLETFLVANFDYLFPELKLVDRQYRVQSGEIDILARDRDGYVVIELKKERATERLVSQLARYMDDVAKWVAANGASEAVRGLVITSEADAPMRQRLEDLARANGRRVDWMVYEIEFELRPSTDPARASALPSSA